MVLGTFAYCGSGQDTLADGFCKFKSFKKYCLGDIIREIADRKNLSHERVNLQIIRKECDKLYGREYVPLKLLEKIQLHEEENIIITGIRTIQEYHLFKEKLNLVLLFVYADEEIRFNRMLRRSDVKDENSLDLLQLRMNTENKLFDYERLERYADVRYDFNISLEEYIHSEKNIIFQIYNDIIKRQRSRIWVKLQKKY